MFTLESAEYREAPVVVVGGGAAGCMAAIKAAKTAKNVILLSKCPLEKGGATKVAEKFCQAPFGHEDPRDNPAIHLRDIVEGGYHLSDQTLAKALADDACAVLLEIESYGARFEKTGGRFKQWPASGLTYPRACSPVNGGSGILRALHNEIKRRENIVVIEDALAVKLVNTDNGIGGLLALDQKRGRMLSIASENVILATGGYGYLWRDTDLPPDITGEGLGLAMEAGVEMIDLEMVLFYPTVIVHPPRLYGTQLTAEMLMRRADAVLLNGERKKFLQGDIPLRDRLSALIMNEVKQGRGTRHGGVWLDLTTHGTDEDTVREKITAVIPEKYRYIKKHGVDMAVEPVEVAPMAHYTLGGVKIDPWGATTVPGLYAAGEIAGNCHGANRLPGNALAEALVFGARAGAAAAGRGGSYSIKESCFAEALAELNGDICWGELPAEQSMVSLDNRLRDALSHYCGPVRNEIGLVKAKEVLSELGEALCKVRIPRIRRWNQELQYYLQLRLSLQLAAAVVDSAIVRKESRGHHVREDYPGTDRAFLRHTAVTKDQNVRLKEIESRYVPLEDEDTVK